MKYKRQCYCAHLANNALHTSHCSKTAVLSNVCISFPEPGGDYEFEFTYSIWLNPGVMNAAEEDTRSAHVIPCVVQLMNSFFTGLGKRKRVMDEKELMMPLELGYV